MDIDETIFTSDLGTVFVRTCWDDGRVWLGLSHERLDTDGKGAPLVLVELTKLQRSRLVELLAERE